MSIQKDVKAKMEDAVEHLKTELKGVRTGQANPHMLDNVTVEAYGSSMRLRDVANVNIPEPRQIVVMPFDKGLCAAIGKGIEKTLGFAPIVDSDKVRINIPPMTTELREKMVKYCHELLELCKVKLRNIRQEANKLVRKAKADGDITEDIMHKEEKGIQELTDLNAKKAEEAVAQKQKELSKI